MPSATKGQLNLCYRDGHAARPGWRIGFAYDAALVERLKRVVPHAKRAWNPVNKTWWVDAEHEGNLLALFPDFEAFLRQLTLPGMEGENDGASQA